MTDPLTIDQVLSVELTHPPKPPIIANPVPSLLLWMLGSDAITAAGPGPFSHPPDVNLDE